MSEQFTVCTVRTTTKLRDEAAEVLKRERLAIGEFLRLSLAYVAEHGRLPFDVPEELRGVSKRSGALKKSTGKNFFDL